MTAHFSQQEITSMVRDMLTGQDLSQITGKIVRERVLERLGDRVGDNFMQVKQAVKSALNVVLSSTADSAPKPQQPHPKPEPDTAAAEEFAKSPQHEKHHHDIPQKHEQPKERHASPEPQQPDYDDDVFDDEPPVRKSFARKRARKVALSDSDSASQADSEPPAKPRRKKSASTTVAKRQHVVANSPAARRLQTLKKLCRQLGCTAPPSRLRGKDDVEKYNNVLSHLRSRGVQDPDPLHMTPNEIARHRKRIAREKELEGLDASNIIEEEGRSRRRRASKPTVQLSDRLPSDLSGAELSEKSDSGESEGYAAPSDGSE
ncbi:hypothetical protein BWQ96_03604 [Gracilariopsis chorda]|uniref:Histone chaperone domain-containing protein n=1 Tax=Gracilariopsis chorda TaxID=448386 RepID=A0A2V3IX21_9FLOR|nr:hypothetical protein BWQ96_03604 [Gracilariopsis chorda]|eukprot:PXF46615.1 hypothetical protein BWQ96_03604 [Gracilariopsis chorda]